MMDFLTETYGGDKARWVLGAELYDAYQEWHRANFTAGTIPGRKAFYGKLEDTGILRGLVSAGVRFKVDVPAEEEDAPKKAKTPKKAKQPEPPAPEPAASSLEDLDEEDF